MKSHRTLRLTSRAGLSPVRSGRVVRAQAVLESAYPTATPTIRLGPVPAFKANDRWPEWHRGAIDRLRPVLTRLRD